MARKTKKTRNRGYDSADLNLLVDVFRLMPSEALSLRKINSTMGAKTKEERFAVLRALETLVGDGVVEERDGRYRSVGIASVDDSLLGVVETTSNGTIYVNLGENQRDVFIPQRYALHALPDDKVRVVVIKKARRGGRAEGEIVEIVERSDKRYVGILEVKNNVAFVVVDNGRVPDVFIPIKELKGAQNGQKVLIRLVDWPATMRSPQGEIVDVFGDCGDNNAEMHAILAEFDLPYSYPKDVERAAAKISDRIPASEIASRRDFRDVITFTIDPADAKDFDDALSIRRLENGLLEVGVHIADVTYYVQQNDIIDREARERATSVYLVDRTIPMLPEKLCNELCSLRPNEDKLCFSAVFQIDDNAEVRSEWFGRTIIHSDRRFAYEEAQQIIDGGEDELKAEILELNRLARILRKERFRSGAINFESSEPKFTLDDKGRPLSVMFKVSREANQLIEEFMLLANRSVAEFVGRRRGKSSEKTFVYRVHDVPNPDKMSEFRSFITRFGYSLKSSEGSALAKELNGMLHKVQGRPEEKLISTLAIRSMSKATYTTSNIGHYGLAFSYYTHFTSPIRRYPDVMVHRLLAHYLDGGSSADREYYERECEHSSEMEIRAANAERASIKYKMVEFMKDKIGEEFDGHISGVTEWGIYVELDQTGIEGMVALRDMDSDYFVFDDENYCVRGYRTHKTYTLGDSVRVRVVRADLRHRQLDFDMV